jgi:outer membrane protein OmpA-like peptidoglycan-associated protein
VASELIRQGVPATDIVTIGRGEEDLLVPTADGVREPRNRRVESPGLRFFETPICR